MQIKNILFGAAYYPEIWGSKRLLIDANNMVELGFNTVRMGEFAWSKFFPSFNSPIQSEWIDEAIKLFGSKGIKTIIGTPSATPPKYIFDRYDIAVVDQKGNKYGFGSRRHYCVNSPDYLEVVLEMVQKLGNHYKNNENIVGFQIDNEFGGDHSSECYCPNCVKKFRIYLKNKFVTIDRLNNELGTTSWNQTYISFDEIDLPAYTQTVENPHMSLEYKRFQAISAVEFKNEQRKILQSINEKWEICTNIYESGAVLDNKSLTHGDDFIAIDNYPNMNFGKAKFEKNAMVSDICYGYLQKPFVSLETQCGTPGGSILFPTPRPNDLIRYSMQNIAHGARGIVYFRYRTNYKGAEQYWHGILNHDGEKRRLFYEVKETKKLIEQTYDILSASRDAKVAIMHNKELDWIFTIQPLMLEYDYYQHVENYYKAFFSLGVNVDMIGKDDQLDEYEIIVVPNYMISDEILALKLEEFTAAGKTVIMDYRCGVKDQYNKAIRGTLPNAFSSLLGVEICEYGIILSCDDIKVKLNDVEYKAINWYDYINLNNAEAIATYVNDYVDKTPSITVNNFKKGKAYYIGTMLQHTGLCDLLKMVCHSSGVITYDLPEDVEVITKENGYVLINHSIQNCFCKEFAGKKEVASGEIFNGELEKGIVKVLNN